MAPRPTESATAAKVRRWFLAYGIAVVTFALVDAVWIALVAQPVYRAELGPLLAEQFNLPVAAVFYLGFVALLVHFAVQPNDEQRSVWRRVGTGALYGLATYGTWGLTAWSVLRNFSGVVAITDIAWGAVVCAVVTAVTASAIRGLAIRGQQAR